MALSKNRPRDVQKINLERLGIYQKCSIKSNQVMRSEFKSHPVNVKRPNSEVQASTALSEKIIFSELPINFLEALETVRAQTWRPITEVRSPSFTNSVAKFRRALPQFILKSQLIALYRKNPTLLEKELFSYTNSSQIRIILVNGGLGGEGIVDSNFFFKLMESTLGETGTSEKSIQVLNAFKSLLKSLPTATSLTEADLQSAGLLEDCRFIVNSGFLTLCNSATLEKTFAISMPNFGSLMKILKLARKWVIDSLKHGKNGTMLEASLQQKWVNSKDFWIKFKGLNLSFVLLDCYGGGWCEPFTTPVGIHWKSSGKSL